MKRKKGKKRESRKGEEGGREIGSKRGKSEGY